jgi:hypothetical protein
VNNASETALSLSRSSSATRSSTDGRFADLGGFGVLFAAVVALALLMVRAPQAFLEPQFWAEDGAVFFVEQKLYGIETLFMPYAGYFVLFPRIIAFLLFPFSALYAPALYAAGTALATVWSIATIASARAPYAWLLGALLMVTPHSGENFAVLANVQWIMAPALAFILATPPPMTRMRRTNQLLFVAIAGLTGPFSVLALPLCLIRLCRHRETFDWAIATVCIATAILQCGALLLTPHISAAGEVAPISTALVLFDRTFGEMTHSVLFGGVVKTILLSLLMIVVVAAVIGSKQQWPSLLALFGLLVLVSVLIKFWHQPDLLRPSGNGDRYLFVPRVITIWLIVDVIFQVRAVSIAAALLLMAFGWNSDQWRKPNLPVLDWRSQAWRIDRGEEVHIPINPTAPAGLWTVTLPRLGAH